MSPELARRICRTWADYFGMQDVTQPGTTLIPRDWMEGEDWLTLWPVGERIVIQVAPGQRDALQQIVDTCPPGHGITAADFERAWGTVQTGALGFYALDAAALRPIPTPAVRQLTPADAAAFDAFLARCSAPEQEEAAIAIDNDVVYGAFDGDRIVAGASTFDWCGFVDIGVMTDPDYRRQKLASAVVAAICTHYLAQDDPRVVIYRHAVANQGSRGVAESVGLVRYALVEEVRRV